MSQTRRRSGRGNPNGRPWGRVYRERMRLGLEYCRHCRRLGEHCAGSEDNPLTFGHLVPHSQGGRYTFDNVTILCQECNQLQGTSWWGWLRSLADEERHAPPERRWSVLEVQWNQQSTLWHLRAYTDGQ